MPVRMVAYGVGGGVEQRRVLSAFTVLAVRLERTGQLPEKLVAVATARLDTRALRWFTLLAGPVASARARRIPRELASQTLQRWLGTTLDQVVHDDADARFAFVRLGSGSRALEIESIGPRLRVRRGEITVRFEQQAFSHEELGAIAGRPLEELTQEERRAVTAYEDAVQIGMRQVHPEEVPRRYLSLLRRNASACWIAREGRALRAAEAIPDWEDRRLDLGLAGALTCELPSEASRDVLVAA